MGMRVRSKSRFPYALCVDQSQKHAYRTSRPGDHVSRRHLTSKRHRRWLGWIAVSIVVVLSPRAAGSQTIETVAGGGPVEVQALSAGLGGPVSLTLDGAGNLFVTDVHDLHRVYKIDSLGRLTIVAGLGMAGFSGDGGPATSASLSYPAEVAVDAAGNLFIADAGNRVIRRVDASSGVITTVAGDGTAGFSGDGGPATSARLTTPNRIALDGSGNLFIADTMNFRVRRVDAATGIITTVAGNGTEGDYGDGGQATNAGVIPVDVALDAAGNLYIGGDYLVRRVDAATGIITSVAGNGFQGSSGDGGPATSASFRSSFAISLDVGGNLFIADYNDRRIRRVDSGTGIITTVAGDGTWGFSGDGGPATSASLRGPSGIALDAAGDLLVADSHNARIRRVAAATGIITTFAGNGTSNFSDDGVQAVDSSISFPSGVAVDATGNFFLVEHVGHRVRRVDAATGAITTVAGSGDWGFSGDGGPATSATMRTPFAVALDAVGNLFICDMANNRVRRVDAATSVITTVAGNGFSFSGDGGPATSAGIGSPVGIALDGAGNIFLATGNRIRRVDAITGTITTVAGNGSFEFGGDDGTATSAGLVNATGVALDQSGNLYIADSWDHRVRRVDATTSIITTVAGNGAAGFSGDNGPATGANLASPHSVAVDGNGNFFIADLDNRRIRRVDSETGIITTVAGNGAAGFSGDGGPATNASLWEPTGIALNAAGDLFIADWGTQRIRRVVPESGFGASLGAGIGVLSLIAYRRMGELDGQSRSTTKE